MDELDMSNKSAKNKKGLLIGGVLVFVLLILAVFSYLKTPTKPKKIFTTAIEKVYANTKNDAKELDSVVGKMSLKTDIHSSTAEYEKILKMLNDFNFSYEYGMDFKNKRMHATIDSNYKDKELINASIGFKENTAYISLKDIYSKKLMVPIEGMEDIYSTFDDQSDYETILEYVKDALNKALKDEYFTKEKATVTLDNKNVKVTKNILHLNEKNLKEITSILSNEFNKEEFINCLANITKSKKEDIKNTIEELKNQSFEFDTNETLMISIYTSGKSFIGFEIKDMNDVISILKNKDTNYSYEIKMDGKSYQGNLEIKTDQNNLNLKIYFDIEGINGSLTIDFSYTENGNVPEVDTTNAISIENLSENDQIEIMENLQQKEGIALLIQSFLSFQSFGF